MKDDPLIQLRKTSSRDLTFVLELSDLDDLCYLVLRHLNLNWKLPCLDKDCLRCLKDIFEKMTRKRSLEDVLLKYLSLDDLHYLGCTRFA